MDCLWCFNIFAVFGFLFGLFCGRVVDWLVSRML